MKSQILHVSGSKRTMSIEAAWAIVNMLAGREVVRGVPFPPPITEGDNILHYTGPISVGFIDPLSRSEIARIIREYADEIGEYGTDVMERVLYTQREWDILIDTRTPHITPAGWYDEKISFPQQFPRLEYRHADIYIYDDPMLRRAALHMCLAGFMPSINTYIFEQPVGNYVSCGHIQRGFKYISFPQDATAEEVANSTHVVNCVACLLKLSPDESNAICVLEGEPSEGDEIDAYSPDSQYATTGSGAAGKFVVSSRWVCDLVDKIYIGR